MAFSVPVLADGERLPEDSRSFLRMLDDFDGPQWFGGSQWPEEDAPNTTLLMGDDVWLYEVSGRWGVATRADNGQLARVVEPSYDMIYSVGREGFVARNGTEWCQLHGPLYHASTISPDLEDLIRGIHRRSSVDASEYEMAKYAIRPDQILWTARNTDWLVFQLGDKWGVGDDGNQFTFDGQVVPYLSFDSDEIAVVKTASETAFIGMAGERWSIHSRFNEHCGDYELFDDAIDAYRTTVVDESPYAARSTVRVDEFGKELVHSGLYVYRVGTQWGIGHRACVIHYLPTLRREEHVVPVAGWFVSDDIEMVQGFTDGNNPHRIVGKVQSGWIACDELGRCYGRYETAELAWKAFEDARDETQEPDPAGVYYFDPLEEFCCDEPSVADEERREELMCVAQGPDSYMYSQLRQDEAKLDAMRLPDYSEQLENCHDLINTDRLQGPVQQARDCPAELQSFVNLTPNADYGCYLPIAWFVEFLNLNEGESCRKEGYAWFYGPPHDAEECVYRGAVNDGVLQVEVEVGPEALTRSARFELFNTAPESAPATDGRSHDV